MDLSKVSEDSETVQSSLANSVDKIMLELQEIKNFVDLHQISDWLENELMVCFTKISDIKERMGLMFTDKVYNLTF